MNVLVTGSQGFIGKSLVKRLKQQRDVRVYGCDLYGTGKECFNVLNINKLLDVVTLNGIDRIYHLAAANLVDSIMYPINDFEVNGGGALSVLTAARSHRAKLFMASTGSVHPQEDGIPGTPYGISKGVAEQYMKYYVSNFKVDARATRYFSVYGPGMPTEKRGVIGIFIRNAINNRPLVVEGGDQARAFCYIDDIVDATLASMELPSGTIAEAGRSDMVSIKSLAEMIVDMYGGKIIYTHKRQGDDIRRVADTTELEKVGWKPAVDLEEGIRRTAQWIMQNQLS